MAEPNHWSERGRAVAVAIAAPRGPQLHTPNPKVAQNVARLCTGLHAFARSEEHTSELQSRVDLVCRLLLEKKKAASQHQASAVLTGKLTAIQTHVTQPELAVHCP